MKENRPIEEYSGFTKWQVYAEHERKMRELFPDSIKSNVHHIVENPHAPYYINANKLDYNEHEKKLKWLLDTLCPEKNKVTKKEKSNLHLIK